MVAASKIVLLLSTVAAGVVAAPFTPRSSASTFSVPAVHNGNYHRNGTAAMLKAYAKYGLKPTNPNSILGKRQDGEVASAPTQGDAEYLCQVSIGGQNLNLDFDTGSADLWVFSTLLPSSDQSGHNVYDSTQSSTYQAISGATWSITYADGSGSSGVVGTDVVTIGGTTVQQQAVELASQVSSQFASGSGDGLVGLAFSSINTVQPTPQSTFFDNAQPSLDSPLFAAYLPFQASGTFDFGATDSTHYTGSINYTPVDNSQGFWEFSSTSYMVGSKTYSMDGTTGIADTGTTLILMGDDQVSKYYASVEGATLDNSQGGYVFPCSATLPTLSFEIGSGGMATIPAAYMNFGTADSNNCFGSLQSVGSGNQNIYGDVFFNAYYGIFDASGPQFGFASSASAPSS